MTTNFGKMQQASENDLFLKENILCTFMSSLIRNNCQLTRLSRPTTNFLSILINTE